VGLQCHAEPEQGSLVINGRRIRHRHHAINQFLREYRFWRLEIFSQSHRILSPFLPASAAEIGLIPGVALNTGWFELRRHV
jgi:hypothetical protein